ncbi:MAG: cyclic nucleotide-binding domain-containing protein [Endomicrobiia bacterium]
MNKILFLKNISIFSCVSDETIQRISLSLEEKTFSDKEIIFYEGSQAKSIFIIFSGQVEIIKNYKKQNQKLLRILNPKDIFGEIGLYSKFFRSATAIAKGQCVIFEIDSDVFVRIFDDLPNDGIKILKSLLLNSMNRMEQTSKELASIYSISQIMLEAFKNVSEVEEFLKNIGNEIANILDYSFGIYLYNKFNEEYKLVFCNDITLSFWQTNNVLDKNHILFDITKDIITKELKEEFIENKKIYIFPLIDGKNILGLIIVFSSYKQQLLQQEDKDLLMSITNLVSVSISGLMFLKEEKEKIKLQNIKTKYSF